MPDQSYTGGVQAFPIAGRTVSERERLRGMTVAERQWRAQYIKDQILASTEPKYIREYDISSRYNIIRKIYRFPLDTFGRAIAPMVGPTTAEYIRYCSGKFFLIAFGLYATHYYFKYNQNDWTRRGGWHVRVNKGASVPGDPDYPRLSTRSKPQDYGNKGFSKSPI